MPWSHTNEQFLIWRYIRHPVVTEHVKIISEVIWGHQVIKKSTTSHFYSNEAISSKMDWDFKFAIK